MLRVSRVLLIVMFGTSALVSFSQTPPERDRELSGYLGKWRFIPEQSFDGARDRKLYSQNLISIDKADEELRITREFGYDSVKYARQITVFLDGRGETNTLSDSNGKADLVKPKTRYKKGKVKREIDGDRRSDPPDTETFKLSNDGKRLTIDRRYRPKVIGDAPKFFEPRIETDRLVLERVS